MPLAESFLLQVNSTATQATTSPWMTVAEAAVALGIVVITGTVLTRIVRQVVLKAGGSKSAATSLTQWMGVLTILAAIAVLSTLSGVSSYLTALTVSGIAGLAVSLALQSTISNVIAGVLLQHDHIVHLGDDIQYGNGGVRGIVVKLSLRTTWLKTKDGVVVALSNSSISSGPVLNYSSLARLEKTLDE